MRDSFCKLIFAAGCGIRGTPVIRYLRGLEESQWWSPDDLRAHQLDRARKLLSHAWERSPFYRKHLERHGLDPHLSSLADLREIPAIGKGALRRGSAGIQNRGRGGRLIHSETSGTSGVPLSFYRSSAWDAQHRAAILRGYGWYGVLPWMRSGILWGIPTGKWARLVMRAGDALQNRFREDRFDLSSETLDSFFGKLKGARYLEGYSSMIYELARHINDRNGGGAGMELLLVKGTSEVIHERYREESARAFGRRMTGEYGAAEAGIVAFECPEGTMHVNMEHVIVEVEEGEIIVTNLLSFSFPFIRYRLGDYAGLRRDFSCPCGRRGQVIEEIQGRVGRRIVGAGGRSFPSLTVYYLIKELTAAGEPVARCRAVQRERGRLHFLVTADGGVTPDGLTGIERKLGELVRRRFEGSIDYSVEFVETIPAYGGKQPDFVSEIAGAD